MITTVWEYLDGAYKGLRFSSGDVESWPGCKLIVREENMNEDRRLQLVLNGRSMSEHYMCGEFAKLRELLGRFLNQRK